MANMEARKAAATTFAQKMYKNVGQDLYVSFLESTVAASAAMRAAIRNGKDSAAGSSCEPPQKAMKAMKASPKAKAKKAMKATTEESLKRNQRRVKAKKAAYKA